MTLKDPHGCQTRNSPVDQVARQGHGRHQVQCEDRHAQYQGHGKQCAQDPLEGPVRHARQGAAAIAGKQPVAEEDGQAQADQNRDHQVDAEPDPYRAGADHGRDHAQHAHQDTESETPGKAAEHAGDDAPAESGGRRRGPMREGMCNPEHTTDRKFPGSGPTAGSGVGGPAGRQQAAG